MRRGAASIASATARRPVPIARRTDAPGSLRSGLSYCTRLSPTVLLRSVAEQALETMRMMMCPDDDVKGRQVDAKGKVRARPFKTCKYDDGLKGADADFNEMIDAAQETKEANEQR